MKYFGLILSQIKRSCPGTSFNDLKLDFETLPSPPRYMMEYFNYCKYCGHVNILTTVNTVVT